MASAGRRVGGASAHTGWRLLGVAALGAVAFRVIDREALGSLEGASDSPVEVLGRCALYWASGLWILLLVLTERRLVHGVATLMFALAVATDQCYVRFVNGVGFVPHEMALALTNPGTLLDTVAMYWELAWPVFAVCCAAVFAGAWLVRHFVLSVPARVSLLGGVILVPVAFLMRAEGYGPGGQVAVPLRIPAFLAWYAAEPAYPDREVPYLEPATAPRVDHVVFVVDESVMGSHLGLNGYVRDTTPRLRTLVERGAARSLGIASSACNYSVGSFLTLFSGASMRDLAEEHERFLRRPSSFSYADRAGFHMAFLNSQDYLPWVAFDAQACEERLLVLDVDHVRLPAHAWDHSLIDDLVAFVGTYERTFSIVAKRGVHYPYYDKSPPERRRFEPTLTGPAWSDAFLPNANAYDNAIAWTVDDYLAELHAGLERSGASVLIVYTADHGQVLPGEPLDEFTFRRTHAMLESPTTSVADVPLVLLATGSARALLEAVPAENVSRLSHFDLFASLLHLFGYDASAVAPIYGRHLWDPVPRDAERVFFEGKPVAHARPFTLPDNRAKFAALLEEQERWTAHAARSAANDPSRESRPRVR